MQVIVNYVAAEHYKWAKEKLGKEVIWAMVKINDMNNLDDIFETTWLAQGEKVSG